MKVNTKHKVFALFFIAFFVINFLLPSFVLLDFKVNQEYISNNLCVEKEVVESKCKGNCQLMKSLDKIDKKSNPENINFNIESHINLLFLPTEFNFDSKLNMELKTKSQLEKKDKLLAGYFNIPFLPPILLK